MANTVSYSKLPTPYDATIPYGDHTLKPYQRSPLQRRTYWRPPVFMLSSLLLGVGCAILHHLFYNHWNGVEVSAAWPQIWISRTATALAFLTKLCLAIASSIAYVQQQWLTMHKETFRLEEADSLFGILGDATLFLDLRIWLRHPALAIPALVTWLVPIAAVITPGSLTINNPPTVSTEPHYVPQLSFNGTIYTYQGGAGSAYYLGARENVQRLSQSTAMFGAIPQLPFPANIASYQLTYSTPALRCEDATAILGENFTLFNPVEPYGGYLYFSYVAGDSSWASLNYTDITESHGYIDPPTWETLDVMSSDAATLYVATQNLKLPDSAYYYIQCQLWNSTQTVNFNFTFPSQTITIQSPVEHVHAISAQDYGPNLPADHNIPGLAYVAMMDMFGKVFTGDIVRDHYSGNLEATQTSSQLTSIDWSTRDAAIFGLEQVFQNMTLSLMTDALLIKSPAQAGSVDVTITSHPSRYSYAWKELVLAYGISIACALFSVLIGIQALVRNDASFSNRCSTILRSYKGTQIDEHLSVADDGADPLPDKLKKAKVAL